MLIQPVDMVSPSANIGTMNHPFAHSKNDFMLTTGIYEGLLAIDAAGAVVKPL